MLRDQPRIVVIGTSGAGKTTFARALAARRACPHVEFDALHWGPDWTPRHDFADRVADAIAGDAWVLDGNYSSVREAVWARATAVVWLDYAFPVVFGRAVRRTVRRVVTGESLFGGNRETFRDAFLSRDGIPMWVLRTYRLRRREYPRLLREPRFAHLHVVRLRSPAEADTLLEHEGP